jgi:putative membrane protein
MHSKFDAAAARAIADAVRDLETRSAAELVIEVRARSGSYAHADARFAAALALVSLAIVVYMPVTVPPMTVLLDPIAFFALGLAIAKWVPAVRRAFTSRKERLEAARTQAAALFHERGIGNTSEETGVLLYVSLLERRMEVLADRGLLRKVNANDWNAALAALHRDRSIGPDDVLAAIKALAAILGRDLPAGETNADELGNAPQVRLA